MDENIEQMIEERAEEMARQQIREANNKAAKKFRDSKYQVLLTFDNEVRERLENIGVDKPTPWMKKAVLEVLARCEKEQNK